MLVCTPVQRGGHRACTRRRIRTGRPVVVVSSSGSMLFIFGSGTSATPGALAIAVFLLLRGRQQVSVSEPSVQRRWCAGPAVFLALRGR